MAAYRSSPRSEHNKPTTIHRPMICHFMRVMLTLALKAVPWRALATGALAAATFGAGWTVNG